MKEGYDLLGKPISEKQIQNDIRTAISPYCHCYNITTGTFKSGNRFIRTFPPGTPDLLGFRKKDGKMFFIEVKNVKGRLSKEQKEFAQMIKAYPVLYGVARSAKDALEILEINFK